jgi:serine/threonine-protein kinase
MSAQDVFLKHNEWYDVRIEKIENNIHLFLNNIFQFSYISHLPLAGTHIGLLLRDDNFVVKDFYVYVGSQNVTVNCLAVPDAFLAHKDYGIALTEYRRIGYSFPGRAEGREAMFRAGVTLLEQANNTNDQELKSNLYDAAHEEFQKLHNTPGAPLEYLGKALIYQALGDFEEEAKCFELAYRRYPRHPLLPILQEQIAYRMHESSRYNRQATFNFILLTLKYLPDIAYNSSTTKLLQSLDKHWEPLFFIEPDPEESSSQELKNMVFAIKLAFWLGRPYVLSELVDVLLQMETPHPIAVANALFCLIELGSWKLAEQKLKEISKNYPGKDLSSFNPYIAPLECAILSYEEPLNASQLSLLNMRPENPSRPIERTLIHLMERAIDEKNTSFIHHVIEKIKTWPLTTEGQLRMRSYLIWAYLLDRNWTAADEWLHTYPLEQLSQETSLLHFLYGCWLEVTEGKDISTIHFSGVLEMPYPRTWTLFSAFLNGKVYGNQGWIGKSFLWERKQLYRQLALFYDCTAEHDKAADYQQKAKHEVIEADFNM